MPHPDPDEPEEHDFRMRAPHPGPAGVITKIAPAISSKERVVFISTPEPRMLTRWERPRNAG
jgi:hypothetical protein